MWIEQNGTQPLVIGVLSFALENNDQDLTGGGYWVLCIKGSHEYHF